MLSLGIANKFALPSLTRICENGKWKILICPRGAHLFFREIREVKEDKDNYRRYRFP